MTNLVEIGMGVTKTCDLPLALAQPAKRRVFPRPSSLNHLLRTFNSLHPEGSNGESCPRSRGRQLSKNFDGDDTAGGQSAAAQEAPARGRGTRAPVPFFIVQ